MAGRAQNLKDQVGQLWRGAVAQAEGVADQLRSQSKGVADQLRSQSKGVGDRVRGEIDRLRSEREQLLGRLGEQTLSWVNANRSAVPGPLKPTVEKLNKVIERLTKHESSAKAAPKQEVHAAPAQEAHHEPVKHSVVKRSAKKKAAAAPKATAAAKKKPVAAKSAAPVKTIAKVSKQPVSRKVLRDEQPA